VNVSISRELGHYLDCISHSEEQTQRLGLRLGTLLGPGSLVLLEGTLGAGKTVFAQGVALGLEVKEAVTSPTFTLIKEYRSGRLSFYHVDLYRIDAEDQLLTLGLEEYLEGDGVCVVEWGRKLRNFLPPEWLLVVIEIIADTKRSLHLEAQGRRYCDLLQEYRKHTFGI